ncbi:MAG: hypothetical protein Q9181_006017 [Wetmoreana brouardii]
MEAFCQSLKIDLRPSNPVDAAEYFGQPQPLSPYFRALNGEQLSKELLKSRSDSHTFISARSGPAEEDWRGFLKEVFIDRATKSATRPKGPIRAQTTQEPFLSGSEACLLTSQDLDMHPSIVWVETKNNLPAESSSGYEDPSMEGPTFFTTYANPDLKDTSQKSTSSKPLLPRNIGTQKQIVRSNANTLGTQRVKSDSKAKSSRVLLKDTLHKPKDSGNSRDGTSLIHKKWVTILIGLGVK